MITRGKDFQFICKPYQKPDPITSVTQMSNEVAHRGTLKQIQGPRIQDLLTTIVIYYTSPHQRVEDTM